MPDTDKKNQPPVYYWRLWLLDAALVSAGVLLFLAAQYGTCEFLRITLVMALLPFIPVIVLVGGAGGSIFALTKIYIEKHSLKRPAAVVLLVGPALVIILLLGLFESLMSPGQRLSYVCAGNAPVSASHAQVTGYSGYLRCEWLAVFNVDQAGFQTLVDRAKLEPVPGLEFNQMLERSSLKATRPFQNLPRSADLKCFRRIYNEQEERERGSVYATYDPATSTAVVFREYHD